MGLLKKKKEAPCFIKDCTREVYGTVFVKFKDKDIPPVPYSTCHYHQKVVAGIVTDLVKRLRKEGKIE